MNCPSKASKRRKTRSLWPVKGKNAAQPHRVRAPRLLREEMLAHGINIRDEPVFDGKLHNVDAEGDAPGSRKAWYWGPPDGRYAAYGHHRPDINERCKLTGNKRFSPKELKAFRKDWTTAKRSDAAKQDAAKQVAARRACRERAQKIWDGAEPASTDHWYLKRKNVQPHGTRQHCKGDLIVPVVGSDGTLHGLQFIKDRDERSKVFLTATRKHSSYFLIGGPISEAYGIAEGFATGASVHEALGMPIACAFDAGNIDSVADALCRLHPHAEPTIFADNDTATERKTGKNPGLDAARKAASSVGAKLAIPVFVAIKKTQTDFNDLGRVKGATAIREAFANAQTYASWPPRIVAARPDPYTDLANAQRLVAAWGRRLAYTSAYGWYEYGPPWHRDGHAVGRFAGSLGQVIRNEGKLTTDGAHAGTTGERADRQANAKWAAASENRGRISSTVCLAKDYLAVPSGHMDPHPHLLGFPNGVLDLNTRIVRGYQPGDLVSLTLGCPYDPDAQAPRFRKFLREVFPDAKTLRRFLQCVFGYALLGQQIEHIVLILFGGGRNGKGALLRALMHVFGHYAIAAPPNLLVATKSDRHPVEIATLAGKRLVVHGETNQNSEFDAAKMKGLTGGDILKARGMHKDFFDFRPSHLLVMHTNHMLRVRDTTAGFWDRVKVVPFSQRFTSKSDAGFEETLRAEASGILNWLLEGLWIYKREGLKVPQAVKNATTAYRHNQDEIETFLREMCVRDAGASALIGELYDVYTKWASTREGAILTKDGFGAALEECGFSPAKGTGGKRIRRGIRLR
jgi:P4 family phage/plasmid primase-like protien